MLFCHIIFFFFFFFLLDTNLIHSFSLITFVEAIGNYYPKQSLETN